MPRIHAKTSRGAWTGQMPMPLGLYVKPPKKTRLEIGFLNGEPEKAFFDEAHRILLGRHIGLPTRPPLPTAAG